MYDNFPPAITEASDMNLFKGIAAFLFINAAYIGVPVVGWGFDDVQGFFANPARAAYAAMGCALALFAGIFVAIRGPRGDQKGDPEKLVRRQSVVLQLVRVVSLALLIAMPWADRRDIAMLPGGDTLRFAGLALFMGGMALSLWATIVLGKNFSMHVTIQKDHELVTQGPFRYIRNPRYLGILLFILGGVLIFGTAIGLAGFAALLALILYRIHDEEQTLAKEFGDTWRAYTHRTWRLIPPIY
jgi:protein-S-isoprenylcysteine O-methyltransferase Ste14